MFILLYSLLLTLALALSAPWWLWRMATSNRYREGLTQRLGFVPPALRQAVQGSKTIWLHAVSVGEVLAAERLVRELRERLPGCAVVVSTTTAAGQKIARERFGAELVFYLPLDFAFAVRPYLRAIRPQMLILMESELWPRLLFECERAAIPVAVVNARISDRSFPRYLRMRALWRPLLAKVALFLAQGDETAERLRRIGAPPERVQVSGNLKYDLQPGEETRMKSLLRSASRGRHILVAGSTVSGKPWNEEELLFQAMDQVWSEMPQVLLVLAPRHPQRFPYARSLALEHGVTAASELDGGRSLPLLRHTLLLDTLGDLSSLYELADAAFIGGSLVLKGGHNPLEAARFGVPVVIGGSFQNFREIVEGMRQAGAIRITTAVDLAETLLAVLRDDGGMGERGRVFFEGQTGATARTLQALLALLPENSL